MHRAWCCLGEVPYCFSRSSIKFQGHTGQKNGDFDQNWAFLECNSSLNSPMALKWCTKLDVVLKRCPIVFRGHPSNFKVTRDKNHWFWPELSISGQWLRFEFTEGFEKMHKAWCNVEEVRYNFSRSSIKFQGRMGWKILYLNSIWVRLLGRSQLSNPSDLPCWRSFI